MIYENIIKSVPINKGWSADKKYHVWDKNGGDYLLRISSADKRGGKSKSFALTKLLAQRNISMSFPIEFGICENGVYSIWHWIDGRDASEVIPVLSFSK